MNTKILNSVCFIRKYGHRNDEQSMRNRFISLMEQIKYNNMYQMNATYLFEYDSLIDEEYFRIIKLQKKDTDEVGLWFEVVRELVEKAGLDWRGRDGRMWDPGVNPGFLMSYSKEEKYKLIDTAMETFCEKFGYYPKTVGAWLLDTESMAFMSEKYEIDAFIICREQWGMDGYTLWGGPYYGGYYPSKNNMQTPAQSLENQINTPVFRMFINDPIYCYYEYAQMKYNKIDYGLFTQEPSWMCGQNPEWNKWQFDNIFENNSVGFRFIQLGQENSFGWEKVSKGLPMQMDFVKQHGGEYEIENLTVGEMGRRFKELYDTTPEMAVGALTDWADLGNQSVWYNNKHYRLNMFADSEEVWIRDIHVFFDEYRDKYLDNPSKETSGFYDNPPIMDGIRFSDETVKAGMYFGKGRIVNHGKVGDIYQIQLLVGDNEILINMLDDVISICGTQNFTMQIKIKENCQYVQKYDTKKFLYHHGNVDYEMKILKGDFLNGLLESENKEIILKL